MNRYKIFFMVLLVFLVAACNRGQDHSDHEVAKDVYTCPMPQDSIFSDKPGKCPKCGMDLVKVEVGTHVHEAAEYTCPMHPEVRSDKPGACPICGMDLVKKESGGEEITDVELGSLLKPTNEFVVSSIPVTSVQKRQEQIEIEALGNIRYDTREVGSISARVAGRIEKLYVRYRYQKISKGQRILDIYSPEILTAQQNLLFLLKNDAGNQSFIQAARERLLLLGMSARQLDEVIRNRKASNTISIFSEYSGHIHESVSSNSMNAGAGEMRDISLLTEELALKEGMYLQKGQSVFTVFNPARAWAVLNIYGENQALVKVGNPVSVVPETAPDKDFRGKIDFIEPFYRAESKTLTARVHFNNANLNIPIGSQVRATISGNTKDALWLPAESVVSLGLDRVVFLKSGGGFMAHKITTGIRHDNHIQVISGLNASDEVAGNAQFLMDSESFIKLKSQE